MGAFVCASAHNGRTIGLSSTCSINACLSCCPNCGTNASTSPGCSPKASPWCSTKASTCSTSKEAEQKESKEGLLLEIASQNSNCLIRELTSKSTPPAPKKLCYQAKDTAENDRFRLRQSFPFVNCALAQFIIKL